MNISFKYPSRFRLMAPTIRVIAQEQIKYYNDLQWKYVKFLSGHNNKSIRY